MSEAHPLQAATELGTGASIMVAISRRAVRGLREVEDLGLCLLVVERILGHG
jgi:hypothetical protein